MTLSFKIVPSDSAPTIKPVAKYGLSRVMILPSKVLFVAPWPSGALWPVL